MSFTISIIIFIFNGVVCPSDLAVVKRLLVNINHRYEMNNITRVVTLSHYLTNSSRIALVAFNNTNRFGICDLSNMAMILLQLIRINIVPYAHDGKSPHVVDLVSNKQYGMKSLGVGNHQLT